MPGWTSLPGCEGVSTFHSRPSTLTKVFREQGSSVISLLGELLKLDWRKRINAIDALQHPYFKSPPLPAKPGDLPQFEESHELDRRKFRGQRAALPPAPAGGTVGMGPNGEWVNGSGLADRADVPRNIALGPQNPPRSSQQDGRNAGNSLHNRGPTVSDPQASRRTAWQRDHGLPPRPPPSKDGFHYRTGEGPPMNRQRFPPHRVIPQSYGTTRGDTYIPSYTNGSETVRDRDDRPDREERNDRGRFGDRGFNEGGRRRSRSPANQKEDSRPRYKDTEIYRR